MYKGYSSRRAYLESDGASPPRKKQQMIEVHSPSSSTASSGSCIVGCAKEPYYFFYKINRLDKKSIESDFDDIIDELTNNASAYVDRDLEALHRAFIQQLTHLQKDDLIPMLISALENNNRKDLSKRIPAYQNSLSPIENTEPDTNTSSIPTHDNDNNDDDDDDDDEISVVQEKENLLLRSTPKSTGKPMITSPKALIFNNRIMDKPELIAIYHKMCAPGYSSQNTL